MMDILLDSNYDLLVENGDWAVGESTRQHQALILLCEPGANREFPTRGIGLAGRLLEDQGYGALVADIKREFEADGMKVELVKVSGGNIQVEGQYE